MTRLRVLLVLMLVTALPVFAIDQDTETGENIPAHGIASERLKNIMQNLNQTVTDTGDPDKQPEEIAEQDLQDMQEAVEELLFHAELLTTDIPKPELDETDLVTFRAIAGQLYTETLNIKQISENYSLNDQDLLYSAYHRLYQTCAACHDLFRDR